MVIADLMSGLGAGVALILPGLVVMEQPPLPPVAYHWTVLLIAVANPLVWVVAFLMGRACDQWQKLIVVAFAAAFVGLVCNWVATSLDFFSIAGYSATGVFIAQMLIGILAGAVGYLSRRTS